jgi:hypothetical protein
MPLRRIIFRSAKVGPWPVGRFANIRLAGKSAIIEFVAHEPPAFMRLALDIGLAGFALGVKGVEGEIEIMRV